MEWTAEGVVVAVRPHGESSAILELFTAAHGRHAGVVRGGTGRRLAPVLMPGNRVMASWRGRLAEHLGHFTVEPGLSGATAAGLLGDRRALAGLAAVCALIRRGLPERDPHPRLHAATLDLLDRLGQAPDWPADYLRWECTLLAELGFGLDLAVCAVTGARDDLAWVSPRTGRAVSRAGARGWEDRLLPLPPTLVTGGPFTVEELAAGLRLTGHFLHKGLTADPMSRPVPTARTRLVELLARG